MKTLAEFLNCHAGQVAWMFGKGPSFQGFDFSQAGPIRCAINDVAAHVPGLTYAFANDGVKRWAHLYRPVFTLFQPDIALSEYDSTAPGAVPCDVVTFPTAYHEVSALERPPAEMAECLSTRSGTLRTALQILKIMGIRKVNLVGFDGGGGHAQGIQWMTRLRACSNKDYLRIRDYAIKDADRLGLELAFHSSKTNNTNTPTP